MREADLQRKVLTFAQRLGLLAYKIRFVGKRGAPDTVIIVPQDMSASGHYEVLWLELKRPGLSLEDYNVAKPKRMTHQKVLHMVMSAAGAHVLVANDLEKAKAWIRYFVRSSSA